MHPILFVAVVVSLVGVTGARAEDDSRFVAGNLSYSREFYAKVHFVAIASSPATFKFDRYPENGPERIQTIDGTYLRQHGQPWRRIDQPIRSGLPLTYAEKDRYTMSFAGKNAWGRSGDSVGKEVADKLEGWIRLVNAAFTAPLREVKLVDKSEADGRSQWIFEVGSSDTAPKRLTFRKPTNDETDKVLLHEFSVPWRVEGEKAIPASATNDVRFGFGYMMPIDGGQEVSQFVWEEMHP